MRRVAASTCPAGLASRPLRRAGPDGRAVFCGRDGLDRGLGGSAAQRPAPWRQRPGTDKTAWLVRWGISEVPGKIHPCFTKIHLFLMPKYSKIISSRPPLAPRFLTTRAGLARGCRAAQAAATPPDVLSESASRHTSPDVSAGTALAQPMARIGGREGRTGW